MKKFLLLLVLLPLPAETKLRAGVAAVPITPFGENADWSGPREPSGVWGDARNRIWLAGFGNNRPAIGRNDDLWARALVLEAGGAKVALVSLDLIGYFQDAGYYGVEQVKKLLKPGPGLKEIIVSSTHNHEGPDTIGLWGPGFARDGKYADYLKFIDRQIARAINQAADPAAMVVVRARFGMTNPQRSATLRGLQVRTGHRPPPFFDEELRAMQLTYDEGPQRHKVLATLVNWNTHPESMESRNQSLTSDFPHYVREAVEKKYGGTAVYFSGALGAAEIVGDAVARGGPDYEDIGGRRFPLDPKTRRPAISFERTQAIGEAVARAVFDALASGRDEKVRSLSVRSLRISSPVTNPGYLAAVKAGILTNAGREGEPKITTTLYHLRLGPADLITLPGEIFPELIYGVEKHRRTDCPQAHTGRPYEPAVLPLLRGKYRFVLGLAPDELGYVVPQYDFTPFPPQQIPLGRRTPDACKSQGVPDHYHETNAVSYRMAPLVTCGLVELLGGKPAKYEACAK